MVCKNCGAIISYGLRECEFCGSPVDIQGIAEMGWHKKDSLLSIMTVDERDTLMAFLNVGKHAEAQRFIKKSMGVDSQQAYEMVKNVIDNKDVPLENVDSLYEKLTSKSKDVLYMDNDNEKFLIAEKGAQNKYLTKLGYNCDEEILLLYDNAIVKTGESGFVVTDKGFYSSGFFLSDKSFFVSLEDVKTVYAEGSTLYINGKKVEITLIDARDYCCVSTIISRIIHKYR